MIISIFRSNDIRFKKDARDHTTHAYINNCSNAMTLHTNKAYQVVNMLPRVQQIVYVRAGTLALVLIASMSTKDSGNSAHMRRIFRTIASHIHKAWMQIRTHAKY